MAVTDYSNRPLVVEYLRRTVPGFKYLGWPGPGSIDGAIFGFDDGRELHVSHGFLAMHAGNIEGLAAALNDMLSRWKKSPDASKPDPS